MATHSDKIGFPKGTPLAHDSDREQDDEKTPEAFRKTSALSRHISYLKDLFRAYKDFTDPQLDTIEFMLQKLYRRFDMDDHTDFSSLPTERYPTMSDFYDLLEDEYNLYDQKKKNLFTEETFSIPSHQFLFNAGNSDPQDYIRTLQMEEAEFNLIRIPERGICLYRCGSERYLLNVKFPEFKKIMFGEGGGT